MPLEPPWTIPLDDGLVMRGAVREDEARLSDYNADVHNTEPVDGHDGPAFWIGEWTRDLLTKPHPSMRLDDILVVEDTRAKKIVSSCVYFQQTWSYCGIDMPFGRPELVSTHAGYRNRGLIRKQFDVMHRWGDERGHLAQGITGIPYYYRQFGYEMALGMGLPLTAAAHELPQWKQDDTQTVRLRKAERSDALFIHRVCKAANERSLFSPLVNEAEMEYQFFDRDGRSALYEQPWIIEDGGGNEVGFTAIKTVLAIETAEVYVLEFANRSMFSTHTLPFLKSLRGLLEELPNDEKPTDRAQHPSTRSAGSGSRAQHTFDRLSAGAAPLPETKSIQKLVVHLSDCHPALPFLPGIFRAGGRPYAWYMRVPAPGKFLKVIAPVLEQRLVGTSFEGLTGERVIGFYRSGVKLSFMDGRLVSAEDVRFPRRENAFVNLPGLTFLNMLFGRKSFGEIADLMPDANAKSAADEALIDTLFPKMASDTRFAVS